MRKIAISIVLTCLVGMLRAQSVLDLRAFGATGDGITVVTRTLQAAIDTANARYSRSGQPVQLRVPAGRYVTGTLYLKSGVDLHLDSGAVLLGSLNPFDYVCDPTCRLMALLFAVGQHDIALTGPGTIDGRGWEVANNMVGVIHLGLVQDPLRYDRPNETARPQNVHFRACQNVIVRQVTLKDPANWCQEYDRCRNLIIEGIKVDAKCYWNNDGLDVVDCSDVVIRNCFIDASDDAYCFKSHSVDGVSENILVEHCVGRSSANGIKFGTLTRGTFRHFRFHDILIYDTYRSAITIASVDGALVEDVVVDSLRSINTGNPIFLRFSPRNKGKVQPALRNIVIRNLYAEVPATKPDAGYSYEGPVEDLPRNISPSSIVGCPGLRIQHVTLENVHIVYPGHADSDYAYRGSRPDQLAAIPEWERRYPEFSMWKELPAWALYIRHADDITLRNVRFQANGEDYRPALVADDVEGLTLDGVLLDHSAAEPGKVQFVANGVSRLKQSGGSRLKVRSQRPVSAVADNALTASTSDLITAADNTTLCSEGATLYKASLFGCKSNGTWLNTGNIQKAIDYIAAQGGGTLVFEVGRYLTGSLQLRPGVNIQLNEGAILVGSPNPYDYLCDPQGRPVLILWEQNAKNNPAPNPTRIQPEPNPTISEEISGQNSPDFHLCGLGHIQLPAGVATHTAANIQLHVTVD